MARHEISIKQKILRTIERLPEGATYDRILHTVALLRNIDEAEQQFARGEWIDHDELFDELLKAKHNAKNANPLGTTGKPRSQRNSGVHRKARPKDIRKIHQASQTQRAK
jgi:hypothetical protein